MSSSVRLDGRRARRAAAVVDEDVDPAEGLERRLDEPCEVLRVPEVAADGKRSEAFGLSLEQVTAAREHRHVGAFGREGLGDREPDARGGSAHDGGAAFEA